MIIMNGSIFILLYFILYDPNIFRLLKHTPLLSVSCQPYLRCPETLVYRPALTLSEESGQVYFYLDIEFVISPILGHIDSSSYLSNMWKEIKSGFLSATVIASTICLIGTLWAYADDDNVDINKT